METTEMINGEHSMLYHILMYCIEQKNKNKEYVKSHYDGKGIDDMPKEELRDYYIALGKWDMCREILDEIARQLGMTYEEMKDSLKRLNNGNN